MTTEVNISFNEGLNLIKENNLHQDPESEIIKIQETFSNVIKNCLVIKLNFFNLNPRLKKIYKNKLNNKKKINQNKMKNN